MNIKNHQTLLRVFAFLFVIAISILVFSIRDQATQLIRYGLPGIFLFSLLANATVLLPAPGVFLVFAMGAVLPPVWVGIAAGLGAAVGELFGYLAGFSGQAIVEHIKHYNTIVNWMRNHKITRNFDSDIEMLEANDPFDELQKKVETMKKTMKARIFSIIGYIKPQPIISRLLKE